MAKSGLTKGVYFVSICRESVKHILWDCKFAKFVWSMSGTSIQSCFKGKFGVQHCFETHATSAFYFVRNLVLPQKSQNNFVVHCLLFRG